MIYSLCLSRDISKKVLGLGVDKVLSILAITLKIDQINSMIGC